MLHLSLRCIIWFIKKKLQYKPFQTCLWFFHIELFLQCLYNDFSHNPKKNLEFTKLEKIMETNGNKIICHIKTR